MAAVSGKGGTILYGGVSVASLNGWSMDVDTNMLEVTSFTTSATVWREFAAGLNGASGNITGFWDSASTAQNDMRSNVLTPASAAVVLELDQTVGGKFSGTAFLSRYSPSADIDGTANLNYDLQFTGAVTYATAT